MATPSTAKCSSCSNLFKDPRMLPCLHTFCLQCIQKESEIQGAKEALKCPMPTCGEKVTLPEGRIDKFPLDLRKAHEAEIARCSEKLETGKEACDVCVRMEGPAVAFCVNCCEFLCKLCEAHHRSARKSQKHDVVMVDENSKSNKENEQYSLEKSFQEPPMPCAIHTDEVLKFYCEKCEELICRDCMELSHNEHRSEYNRVEAIAAKVMESLKACAENNQSAVAVVEDAIAKCKVTIQQVEARKKEIDDTIARSLNQVREALLTRNEEIYLEKTTSLGMQVEKLKKVSDDLTYTLNMIAKAESHTPAQQLSTKKVITERVEELMKRFQNSERVPLESAHFLTKVADQEVISQMIALCQISGGSDAASSTCDVGYVPRAVVGKERTVQVTAHNADGEHFPYGKETVTAELSLMGSKEPCIHGTTTDHGDGTYSISFTPQSAGEHELQMKICGRPIKGSPFLVNVRQPRTTPYDALSQQKVFSTYQNPWDVAFTEDGILAVAEYGYHTVSLYTVEGRRLHTFGRCGSSGSGDNQFYSPSGVAISGDVMYVTENNNHRVQKFRISDKTFISKFGSNGSGDGQFSNPRGICTDPEGKLFIADYSNHRVQVFQPDGTFAYVITGDPNSEGSKFQSPWGVAFDLQGRLHIAAYGSNCIKVYTPEGVYVESYGSDTLKGPAGIAIDSEGYIAVSEWAGSCRLVIYNPDHTQVVKTIANFNSPAGIACDAEGMFWIAEYGHSRVQKY